MSFSVNFEQKLRSRARSGLSRNDMRSLTVTTEVLLPMSLRRRECRLGKMVTSKGNKWAISICISDISNGSCRYKPNEYIDVIGLRSWIHLWMFSKQPWSVSKLRDTKVSNHFPSFWESHRHENNQGWVQEWPDFAKREWWDSRWHIQTRGGRQKQG